MARIPDSDLQKMDDRALDPEEATQTRIDIDVCIREIRRLYAAIDDLELLLDHTGLLEHLPYEYDSQLNDAVDCLNGNISDDEIEEEETDGTEKSE